MENFGTAPLVVQPEDEAEMLGALPEEVLNSQKVDFSAGEKFFERCLSAKASWPSLKPEVSFFAGEYDKLQTPFLSRVVQPVMLHDWLPGEFVGWVLNTSRWSVQMQLRAREI